MGDYTDRIIVWRGRKFNQRTIDMILEAELLYGARVPISQGSFNSSVSQSAGTHDGGGAVDWAYTNDRWIRILRTVGFAAWVRNPNQGNWNWHTHGVALDDSAASRGAKNQMAEYRAGGDGLVGNRPDYHWRPNPILNWEQYKLSTFPDDEELPDTGGDMPISNADARKIALAVASYKNPEVSPSDFYSLAYIAARDAAYAVKQNKSIAGAVYQLAKGSNDITPEELKAVADAASGKDL